MFVCAFQMAHMFHVDVYIHTVNIRVEQWLQESMNKLWNSANQRAQYESKPLKLSMPSSRWQRAVCCSASRSLCSGQRRQCQRAKRWKWVSAQSHSGCNTYITCAPVQTYRGRESRGELEWRHLPNLNLSSNSRPLFTHKKRSVTRVFCLSRLSRGCKLHTDWWHTLQV